MPDNSETILKNIPRHLTSSQSYTPGKSVDDLTHKTLQKSKKNWIKLSSNESGYPPPPSLRSVYSQFIQKDALSRYPDDSARSLRATLAKKHNVSESQVVITNGSNDAIVQVTRLLLSGGGEAICSKHCFAVFPWIVAQLGNRLTQIPTKKCNNHAKYPNLEKMQATITKKTKVLYLANPDNPTGAYIPAATLQVFLASLPKSVAVLIDQAYFEYITHETPLDYASLLEKYPQLIVLRTFSKAYGLAQLRIGYLIATPKLATLLKHCRLAFSVNGIAMRLAQAALGEAKYYKQQYTNTIAIRSALATLFEKNNIAYLPSQGNFISFLQTDRFCYKTLLQQGILSRELHGYGLAKYARISIGSLSEMRTCTRRLHTLLA